MLTIIASTHLALAIALFFLVNWIGVHAAGHGYVQLTLFARPDEAPAFNFVLRTAAPAVLTIVVSMSFYLLGLEWLVKNIWLVAAYYYVLRIAFNLLLGRAHLINWTSYVIQVAIGTALSYLAYKHLILPRTPLFPDAATLGNELWLGIAIFVFAILNTVSPPSLGAVRRKNRYIKSVYNQLRKNYSDEIEGKCIEPYCGLAVYAILIQENFNRPALVRIIERALHPRFAKTIGIMQVNSGKDIGDRESVRMGVNLLNGYLEQSRQEFAAKPHLSQSWILRSALAKYNRDDNYLSEIEELMRILAHQIDGRYRTVYENFAAYGPCPG